MPDTTIAADRRGNRDEMKGRNSSAGRAPGTGRAAWQPVSDGNLIQDVARALRATGRPALRALDIEVSAGIVILWGRVPSYHQKQLAQEAARSVAGVSGIANGLEVVCYR